MYSIYAIYAVTQYVLHVCLLTSIKLIFRFSSFLKYVQYIYIIYICYAFMHPSILPVRICKMHLNIVILLLFKQACLDGFMNIAMEQTEEYYEGQLKNRYGDCFIRGNNGEIQRSKYYTTLQNINVLCYYLFSSIYQCG